MMLKSNKKFELSPRLKLGVGRSYSPNKILKLATIFCLVATLILAGNAIRLVLSSHKNSGSQASSFQPQVLGVSDNKQTSTNDQKFTQYKVKKGDTLFNLSQQFHIDWMTLATLNNLASPFSLQPGQILNIPQ